MAQLRRSYWAQWPANEHALVSPSINDINLAQVDALCIGTRVRVRAKWDLGSGLSERRRAICPLGDATPARRP